jgi:microcystin degradation protein MlrC
MARQIETEHDDILAVNVLAGFSFADTPDTGVSLSAVTLGDPELARRELRRLREWTMANKECGNIVDPPIESVMAEVLKAAECRGGPVLIVEPSDNIGGGAPGDGTGVLKSLLKHQVENAAVVINDPAAVAQCGGRTIGDRLTLSIGGRQSRITSGPAELDVELLSLSDGKFELEDRHSHLASMYGIHIDMGPCAVVRYTHSAGSTGGGIRILLTTRKTPPFDLGQLRSQGIVPEETAIIGVKAAVAHRRAYEPIAAASFTVDTPGPCSSNLKLFPYKQLTRPVFPLDDVP